MRSATAGILVVLILALSACSSTATKAFTVDVSPYSIEQTPGQIHNYLRARGFQRVKFQDYESGLIVYEKRNSEIDEQRFRLKTRPQIKVIVRLEKRRRTFEKSGPRVIVWFGEDGRRDFSEFALEEYNRLLDEVSQTVGADRVKVWPNQPPGSGQW
jgi:hypothetical protein